MASTIAAGTTSGTAIAIAGDTSGVLQLQTNGTTAAVTIDTNQRAAFVAGTAALPAITTTGDTNTGIFFSAADTIDFAEGGVACGQFDSSANFKFNSGYGSVATAYGCRAWVNFNGTGTPAIRASGNVTSITDNGTGDYTINFTNAMPNANYGVNWTASDTQGTAAALYTGEKITSMATSNVRVTYANSGGAGGAVDPTWANIAIFR
jgi:hypothetical protein